MLKFVCKYRRSVILSRQNMRCAGCGTKVEPGKTNITSFDIYKFLIIFFPSFLP